MPGFLENYQPVEDRLREFWRDHPSGRITTELIDFTDGHYIVQASVYRGDELRDTPPAATGYARETETERGVNATSALENCETSAIGRALANLGYAPKGKRPSREEMQKVSGAVEGKAPAAGEGPADPTPPTSSGGGGPDGDIGEGSSERLPLPGTVAPTFEELVALAGNVAAARELINSVSAGEYSPRTVRNATELERMAALEAFREARP